MEACKHYKKFGMRTEIVPSENPWNAWIYVYDEHGNLYYSSFETGLYWEYLEHLYNSPECLKEVAEKEVIEEELSRIEREWKEKVRLK